jgi:FkbM family methyltransferase
MPTSKFGARWLPPLLKKSILRLRNKVLDVYVVKSYSQEGEDIILRKLFDGKPRGFYVDVGAHHPRRFSNTRSFYLTGWQGINIEPNPDAMWKFQSERSRDINLQFGVGVCSGCSTYYVFDDSALNTFDRRLAESRIADTPYKLTGTLEVPVERLDSLLQQYLPPNQHIDFLSVDVEGHDLQVLNSNDWQLYRPYCVLVESLDTSIEEAIRGEIFKFMSRQGYELLAKTFNTLIFRERTGEQRDRK